MFKKIIPILMIGAFMPSLSHADDINLVITSLDGSAVNYHLENYAKITFDKDAPDVMYIHTGANTYAISTLGTKSYKVEPESTGIEGLSAEQNSVELNGDFVEFTATTAGIAWSLTSLDGKVIKKSKTLSGKNAISISNLPANIYILHIGDNKSIKFQKL